jgi:YegS/Rv2252/BmrU family lipid kinase
MVDQAPHGEIVGCGGAMAKTLVVLNPVSGNGHGARLWPQIDAELRAGGLEFDLVRTPAPRAAVEIAAQAKRDGYAILIAIGGDGTVNEVANGLLRASDGSPAGILGVIPVGSGNDFTKMLSGLPSPGDKPTDVDWKSGVRRILSNHTRWVDVGRALGDCPSPGFPSSPHYYVNGLDTGFGASVAMNAHRVPFLQGTAMYLAAVLKTLVDYSVPHVSIQVDTDTLEQRSTMIAISNGRCIGGGFWIAPSALNDDGLLDIMIAQGLGRMGILSLLPKVMNGTHVGDPRVALRQGCHIVVESPDPLVVDTDGEIPYVGAHRIEVQVLPKHLQVLA